MPRSIPISPNNSSSKSVKTGQDNNKSVLGKMGNFETRLAVAIEEIHSSQRLRYRVFYEELSAKPDKNTMLSGRDEDNFDALCDHLLVLENLSVDAKNQHQIIASSRLLPQNMNENASQFYSNSEFNLTPMLEHHPHKKFLEFGRSCVKIGYRNKRTIELLWQGSWAYVCQNNFDVMFGCASFEGTDPEKIAHSLSFLYHNARAKNQWRVRARSNIALDMNQIAPQDLDLKKAMRQLPPLIKGYLRLGAMIGEDAVIDNQFGTIDVLIILPVAQLNPRYVNHYGKNADRYQPHSD